MNIDSEIPFIEIKDVEKNNKDQRGCHMKIWHGDYYTLYLLDKERYIKLIEDLNSIIPLSKY